MTDAEKRAYRKEEKKYRQAVLREINLLELGHCKTCPVSSKVSSTSNKFGACKTCDIHGEITKYAKMLERDYKPGEEQKMAQRGRPRKDKATPAPKKEAKKDLSQVAAEALASIEKKPMTLVVSELADDFGKIDNPLAQLEERLKTSQETIQEYSKAVDRLKKENEELRIQQQTPFDDSAYTKELEELNIQLKRANAELAKREEDLSISQKKIDRLESYEAAMKKDLEDTFSERDEAIQDMNTYKNKYTYQKLEVERHQKNAQAREAYIAALEQQVNAVLITNHLQAVKHDRDIIDLRNYYEADS